MTVEEKKALREKLVPHYKDRKILLFVGRLTEQKNLFVLLDAVARIASNVLLLLVGDGNLRMELEAYAVKKGISSEVLFWGSVPDTRDFYRMADIFILPSRAEGMPNVLLEAMSCALPCIGSDIPSIRFVLSDGDDGYIFQQNDISVLTTRVTALLIDYKKMVVLAQHARETIEKRFSLTGVGDTYVRLYTSLLHSHHS